jgi:DNA polymerase elongation subunit (family B)
MALYSKKDLENIVLIDIETVSGSNSLGALEFEDGRLASLWEKRCDYLRKKHEDNQELSNEEIYKQKSGLQAEFGKIICITIGYIRFNESGQSVVKTKSYYSDDESDLLKKFFTFLKQLKNQIPGAKLTGHNIKRFDIPFIFKRGMILGLDIPEMINVFDKKPWEIPFIDTADIWSNGAWQESFTSLDILTAVMGIPSPKSDIDGSQVTHVYWQEKDLERIVEYCERDVVATAQLMIKFTGLELAIEENIIKVS